MAHFSSVIEFLVRAHRISARSLPDPRLRMHAAQDLHMICTRMAGDRQGRHRGGPLAGEAQAALRPVSRVAEGVGEKLVQSIAVYRRMR